MGTITRLLLTLLACLFVPLQAQESYWHAVDFSGEAEGGIDLLYWKPTSCPVLVAQEISGGNVGEVTVNPSYDWGLRLSASYEAYCLLFSASWTWLHTFDAFTINPASGNTLEAPGVGSFSAWDTVRPTLKFTFNAFDVRVGRVLHRARRSKFTLYGNGRWLEVQRFQKTKATRAAVAGASYIQHGSLNAGAVGLGLKGDFNLCWGLSLVGDLNTSIGIGERRVKELLLVRQTGVPTRLRVRNDTTLFPILDLKVALRYDWTCRCFGLALEGGYELHQLWNALRYASTPNLADSEITNPSLLTTFDVGFAGPYLSLMVTY